MVCKLYLDWASILTQHTAYVSSVPTQVSDTPALPRTFLWSFCGVKLFSFVCVCDSVSMHIMYIWVCVGVIAWGCASPTFTAALGVAVLQAVKTVLPGSLRTLIACLSCLERVALKCSELKASEQPSIDKVCWRFLQTAAHQCINNAGAVKSVRKRGRVANGDPVTLHKLFPIPMMPASVHCALHTFQGISVEVTFPR